MNFKDMLQKISQLSEATKETKTGKVHTAEPGGYGRKDDEDDEGKKVKDTSTEKKGRGRPKKATQTSGEANKYDFSAFGATGKDVKLKPWDKKKTTKHSLKEWVEEIENKYVAEAEQIQIKPASQMPKVPGQTSQPGQPQQVAGQPQKNTQVIAQGTKTLGTVDNPQLAQQIKQSIGRGEMTLMPGEEDMAEGMLDQVRAGNPGSKLAQVRGNMAQRGAGMPSVQRTGQAVQQRLGAMAEEGGEKWIQKAIKHPGALRAKLHAKPGAPIPAGKLEKATHSKDEKTARQARLAQTLRGLKEADTPSTAGTDTRGAGLGAGRSQTTLEGKKPDFLDLDKDKNKKESMAKAAQDAKKKKKKVKEGMDQRLQAARLEGKSHGLKSHAHCGKNYDDMEEARMYHEGYKEGLDECYGQVPIRGTVVGEEGMPPATVHGMADATMDQDMEEGNAFTRALATTPHGGKFTVGGKTFTDRTRYDATVDETMFESWNNELTSLLEEYDSIQEGMTVSISKGQQGQPDSVSVTAQDQEADQLLQVMKRAGLGLFGGDDSAGNTPATSSPMTVDNGPDEIGVVDDHDGMMALIKKVTGGAGSPDTVSIGSDDEEDSSGYEDEEEEGHDHADDEEDVTCESCGVTESECECDTEQVDEVESEDQMAYEVAEDNAPDSGAEDTEEEIQDTAQANQSASEYDEAEDEELNEWANEAGQRGTDAQFETDIAFMTKVISGGLNKEKSTGQTTVPVIAGQTNRMGFNINESIGDWKKLAGLK